MVPIVGTFDAWSSAQSSRVEQPASFCRRVIDYQVSALNVTETLFSGCYATARR